MTLPLTPEPPARLTVGFVAAALGALAIGGALGLVAVVDMPLSYRIGGRLGVPDLFLSFPYFITALFLAGIVVPSLVIVYAERVWRERFPLVLLLILVGMHLMAIDAGPVNLLNLSIVLLAAIWLLHWLRNPHEPWHRSGLRVVAVLMIAAVLLSAIGHHEVEVFHGILVVLPKMALVIMLVDVLSRPERVRLVLNAMLVIAGIAALVGIAQAVLYYVWFIKFTFMAAEAPRYVSLGGMSFLRSAGFQPTAHGYAQPIMVAALIAAALLFSRAEAGRRWRYLALVLVAVAAIGLSFARSQWVALVVGAAALPFILRPDRSLHWFGFGVLILAAGFGSGLFPWLFKAMIAIAERSTGDRLALFAAGLRVFALHPWNGVGIANFGQFSPLVDRYPVHNAPLQVATETGIFGLTVFLAAFAWVGASLVHGIRDTSDERHRAWLRGLLCGWVGLVIGIQAEPFAYSEFMWIYLTICDAAVRTRPRLSSGDRATYGKQDVL